jgi:serine phosphatase RsbU (regulator of sigma subunit)
MMDPAKFKKLLIGLLKALVVIELVSAFSEGIREKQWARFGIDLVIAGILYVMWDRITTLVRGKKEEYRRRMAVAPHDIGIWDAFIFSLLWSDEIYMDIPADRKRLVVNSYTLIALGLAAAFIGIGSGLMPLVISGALVLAAVNLLVWVVSLERGETESLQTELRLAHDVQTSLMPKEHPVIPGYDIAGLSIPAREVGGDHFDYAGLGSDHETFGICVFDVSGKGMEAAMSAVFTSGAFASEAKQSTAVSDILTRLNRAVFTHSKRGRFVAFLLAMVDVRQKVLTFSNAGQMKPLVKMSGETRWLNSTGVSFPLGMQVDSRYEEQQVHLSPGDVLFLLTDGFTEAMNEQQELFGNDRLEQVVRELHTDQLSAQQMLERITHEVRLHVASAPQHDDMTMVVVKVL